MVMNGWSREKHQPLWEKHLDNEASIPDKEIYHYEQTRISKTKNPVLMLFPFKPNPVIKYDQDNTA